MSAPLAPLPELHLHRLLVAVDGSCNADLALQAAITIARRDHASVTLVSVERDIVAESAGWAAWAPTPGELQADLHAAAEGALRDAVARLPEDVPVTTILRKGHPGPEIVAVAAEGTYDAILLGARGVGRVEALMGSVSQHVLHHAATSVFVMHAARDAALAPAA